MAAYVKLCPCVLITMALMISSVVATPENDDILVAIEEMERANYFTFVMLINMAPPSLFQSNVTFLMPSDRSLSRTMIPENNSVTDILLRHSIPSPLLLDHLLHLPTNTVLPTSNPRFTLKISNSGRRGLFLGNVKIVSPNICTHGYSVRCHGIDGVLPSAVDTEDKPNSSINCPGVASPISAAAPPSLAPASAYETSGGLRPQMELASTFLAFKAVWVVYIVLKSCA